MIFNILIVLIAISFVVFIHELGHFIFAKIFGVNVEKFSIGFGREIFGFTKSGTRYCLAVFPLGGFVKMQGESLVEKSEDIKVGDFCGLHYFKRILIVSFGAVTNIIFAFVVVFFISIFTGVFAVDKLNLEIGSVKVGSPAENAGIKKMDILKKIDGKKVDNWEDVFNLSKNYDGKPILITILRDRKELAYRILPKYEQETSRYILGISSKIINKKVSFLEAGEFTYKYFENLTKLFFDMIFSLFSKHKQKGELIGPVGVVKELTSAMNESFVKFLFLLALVSFNLGLVNLLPLPVLDGGYILIYLTEWIFRIKINQKILEILFSAMFFVMVIMTIFITNKDILRIFKG